MLSCKKRKQAALHTLDSFSCHHDTLQVFSPLTKTQALHHSQTCWRSTMSWLNLCSQSRWARTQILLSTRCSQPRGVVSTCILTWSLCNSPPPISCIIYHRKKFHFHVLFSRITSDLDLVIFNRAVVSSPCRLLRVWGHKTKRSYHRCIMNSVVTIKK